MKKKMNPFLETNAPLETNVADQHPDFSLLSPVLEFCATECKTVSLCCFKPLSLW